MAEVYKYHEVQKGRENLRAVIRFVEKYKMSRARAKSLRTNRFLRPATINRELACLKAVFNRVIKDDVLIKNPVSRVKFLKEDNEQMRVLNQEEQRRYLATASQPLLDIAT